MRVHRLKIIGFSLSFIILINLNLAAQTGGNPDAAKLKNPVASAPQSIDAGKAIFLKSCAVCHGMEGKGDGAIVKSLKPEATRPANLSDAKWDHGKTDGEIFTNIRDGIGPKFEMKGQKGKLTDQDMWNLVNFIHSLAAKGK